MSDASRHPTDLLQEVVAGRLAGDQRALVDAHLAICAQCRRELDALRWAKTQLVKAADETTIPDDLQVRLRRALDEEDARAGRQPATMETDRKRAGSVPWVRWVAAAAAIVVSVWLGTRSSTTPVEQAINDFRQFTTGSLPLEVQTTDPQLLQSRLREANLSFAARVFDFGMMDYRLVGGGLNRVAGQPSALFAYQGPGDRALVCQMYAGSVRDLPPPTSRRSNEGVEFLVYREGDLTVVFWQEGTVVCVLVANGDSEAAIKLAFAKAERV